MLDPFYFAFIAFGLFVLVTITLSACIRKYRHRRHIGNRRSVFVSESVRPEEPSHLETRNYDGTTANLYEAKPNFNYDPELLVTKNNLFEAIGINQLLAPIRH